MRTFWFVWFSIMWLIVGCQVETTPTENKIAAATPTIVTVTQTVTVTPTPHPTDTATAPTLLATPAIFLPHLAAAPTPLPTPTPTPVRFAVIGDYGLASASAADVAALVVSWDVAFIITLGDNNYPWGGEDTIDDNIGQYYADFIFPYTGSYPSNATTNRFFPALGNHDWYTTGAQPYLDYFTLPGNERYYDFVWGSVHLFAIDGDFNEPDGNRVNSIQAQWLQNALSSSPVPWQIVYNHFPPYSSAYHGSQTYMRWPFAAWGVDAVLAGHDHTYERLQVDGIPYFVNGLGGNSIYSFNDPLPESEFRYNADFGAMLVEATATYLTLQFVTRTNELIDSYTITK